MQRAACGADLTFLLRKLIVEFAFLVTLSTCQLQDKLLLMVTPRYFASVRMATFWLCMEYSEQRGLFLFVMQITSHLSAFYLSILSISCYWLNQILIIAPGSANLEFEDKNKTKEKQTKKKNLLAVF